MEQPSYYAILPASVRYDKDLKPMEKILFAELTALSNKDGFCSASNRYFADLYGVDESTVSRWISRLAIRKYVSVLLVRDDRNAIIGRHIFTTPIDKKVNTLLTKKSIPSPQKDQYPIDKKVIVNNTSINITSSNNSLSTREEEIEIPEPTHVWGDSTDTRYETALTALKSYFQKNPSRRREISDEAKSACDETQFDEELTLWLRRYADDFQITQNPVKALTSGRGCFISWLSQTFCRAKYQTNGNDTSTQRNGRVQQQRKDNSFPSSEELRRKYGVL